VAEPAPADLAAVAALPGDRGQLGRLGITTSLTPAEIQERVRLRPNLNIAGLSSGYAGDGIKTLVPASAVAKLDARLVPDQDPRIVFEQVRAAITAVEPTARLTLRGAMPPSRTSADAPFVGAVRDGVAVGFGRSPLLVPALASTLPDYVFTKVLGIPSVIVPYANADQSNHGPDENLAIDNFVAGIQCFAAVMDSLAGLPHDAPDRLPLTDAY
jgi:acetylornithine deacetylase/succinyl-diaminopimelate desuccinylase-like protein